jgi:hypothetical protein
LNNNGYHPDIPHTPPSAAFCGVHHHDVKPPVTQSGKFPNILVWKTRGASDTTSRHVFAQAAAEASHPPADAMACSARRRRDILAAALGESSFLGDAMRDLPLA